VVEPGFLEVSTSPPSPPSPEAEYVIWASTARRTDPLGVADGLGRPRPLGRALFMAGTRFVVLAVDQAPDSHASGAPAGPARVLLREAVGGGNGRTTDEHVLGRLRAALAGIPAGPAGAPGRPSPSAGPEPAGIAIGFTGDARPFALDGGRPAGHLEPAGTA
jgi:hypothetical protein